MISLSSFILSILQCPETHDDLQLSNNALTTKNQKKCYPIIDGIPWLVKNIEPMRMHWVHKKNEFVSFHKKQALKIDSEIRAQKDLTIITKKRLEVLKTAHEFNQKALASLIKGIDGGETGSFDVMVPLHQSMHLYRKNIFRDWGWSTQENKNSLARVKAVLNSNKKIERLCVLGAGAGRLAMDMHTELSVQHTVAVDFNPLLLAVADKMRNAESFSMYDFPSAPVEIDDVARLYELKSAYGKMSGVDLVCADVTDLPFKGKSFDTVLTPWLIDILPFSFKLLAQRVNQILDVGGEWLNFGPLGFAHASEAQNLTRPEIKEQLALCGFALEVDDSASMKYLSADNEVNSRNETVYLFRAKKTKDVSVEAFTYLPDWVTNAQKSIPLSEEIKQHQQLLRFQADLFHSINGQLSMQQIAQLFASHYKMPAGTALTMAANVLRQFAEASKRK